MNQSDALPVKRDRDSSMAQSQNESSPRPTETYNQLFDKFVGDIESGNPIEGLAAYGYYKIAKREWISQFRREYDRKPTEEEVSAYIRTWTPALIGATRTMAEQALALYGDSLIRSEEPRILRDALKGSFLADVFKNLVAAFVYTILLIAVAVILKFSGIDIIGIFRYVGQN